MSRRIDYVNRVPQEVLTYNIFCRLPVKFLGRCKCVSKSWNFLISEPRFVKAHLTETSEGNETTNVILISNEPNPDFLYSVYVDKNKFVPIPYALGPKLVFDCSNTWSRIWGSCDGLILAEDTRTWTSMYLLNPTTFESKRLPRLPSGCRNTCMFGFGYDISCDDYAIVAIAYRQESLKKDACVYVYKLKTNQWNKIGLSPYDHKRKNPGIGIFVGGCLHWLAKNVNDSSWLISAFSIANKKFSQVPVPNGLYSNGVLKLGVLKGCLCMITNVNGPIEMWVMNEYGVAESWVKFSAGRVYSVKDYTLLVLESGAVVLLVTNAKEGKFYIYKKGFQSDHIEFGMAYVDSLVSPNKKDEKQKGRRRKTIK